MIPPVVSGLYRRHGTLAIDEKTTGKLSTIVRERMGR
jgi:hypothetical protein